MHNFKVESNRLKKNAMTPILHDLRSTLLDSYYDGLKSVEPGILIKNSIKIIKNSNSEQILEIKGVNNKTFSKFSLNIAKFKKIVIIGGGKATAAMASELVKVLGEYKECTGIINIPYGQKWGNYIEKEKNGIKSSIKINYCSHPIPDRNGVNGTSKMIELINDIKNHKYESLIFVLISGGGSALMPYPKKGMDLEDLEIVNSLLLRTNANIHEINAVRKHLSDFKGGNLARVISPLRAFSLIISDVIGDDLDVIASGPTVPDMSTYKYSMEILKKYEILESIPINVREILMMGIRKELDENPKKSSPFFFNIENILIGSAEIAKNYIERTLTKSSIQNWNDLNADCIIPIMMGSAADYAKKFSQVLKKIEDTFSNTHFAGTYYLINSGELSVSVKGTGIGGRNQEMLLWLLLELDRIKIENIDYCICSMAFDGIEGNSTAAGAILDSFSLKKMKKLNISPSKFLLTNDSYNFFKKMGDQIEIGHTNTNVNDIIALIFKKRDN